MDKEKRITVNASTTYDVVIGRGILHSVGRIVSTVTKAKTIALITDDVVDKLYADVVEASLRSAEFDVVKYVFANGEKSKNLSTYASILSHLASHQLTRTDAIVALGGGVVGDMAGFVAATYLRGIQYIQIPTTLLAQIDSSVGGKTAVDLPEGKNLVGAFCQPEVVICDIDTLSTLPKDIFLDGMGEAVKYAILDSSIYTLLSTTDYDVSELVYLCVDYKRRIVEKDEKESGLRRILNLGHTIAHGIERLSSYTISHGRAVAMGLQHILRASTKHGYIDKDIYDKLTAVVSANIGCLDCDYSIADIAEASLTDKKRTGQNIVLVMVYGIADVREVVVPIDNLKEYLA